MKVFLKVIDLQLKVFIQYKWGFFIYTAMHPIGILINIALFSSIYNYNSTDIIKGYSLNQMIWYFIAVGFVCVFTTNFADSRISNKILTGDLTMDLLKPISLFRYELANAVALRLVAILMEFVTGMVIYSLIFFPKFLTLISLLKFIAAILLSFLILYFINFLIGLLAFVIKNNTSIATLKSLIISIAGGMSIPLDFFPARLNTILDFLPFKYVFYWPVQIFLNKGNICNLRPFLNIIFIQLFWVIFLYALCKLSWSKAIKRFCAVGG